VLLAHSPFATEAELLDEFEWIPGITGTRLVLYECDPEQYDVSKEDDIRIGPEGQTSEEDIGTPVPHETSLRAYLEVLYYADDAVTPSLKIELRGEPIPPRNWSNYLHEWPEGLAPYRYEPRCLTEEEKMPPPEGKGAYGVKDVRFGTADHLVDVIRVLKARGVSKSQSLSHEDLYLSRRKREIERDTGVFYYNHDRMIMSLVRLPKQKEGSIGNKMMTTEKKLTLYGIGVVGVCREGFLTPEHSKDGYEAKSYEPSVYARPNRPSFQDVHKVQMNEFFKRHLREVLTPAYHAANQRLQQQQQQQQQERLGLSSPRTSRASGAAGAAGSSSSSPGGLPLSVRDAPHGQQAEAQEGASSGGGGRRRGSKRKAADVSGNASAADFYEGGRYCLAEQPSIIGEAEVVSGHGWYRLKLDHGQSSRNVRLGELRYVGFERRQLPPGYRLVGSGSLLEGALANLAWREDPTAKPMPMFCRLSASGVEGALRADYFDQDSELLYIAACPSSGAFVVFDGHGAALTLNPDEPCTPNSIAIDAARLEKVAAALRGASSTSYGAHLLGGNGRGCDGGLDPHADMSAVLERARIPQYKDAWLAHTKTDAFAESVAEALQMKAGHRLRFKSALEACGSPVGGRPESESGAPAPHGIFQVGTRCEAKYGAQSSPFALTRWYPGTVTLLLPDGGCDVTYDDGDFEAHVPPKFLRRRAEQTNGGSSSSTSQQAAAPPVATPAHGEAGRGGGGSFVCSNCGARLKNAQALGGHKRHCKIALIID
jgi:hypothetical protein